ncbi:MAG TPA: DUF3179 domain-containing protein [Dehalococcoidia bacterium]|nr:DUF3179 domain-containing protein [Dehalococcoidia bacterium]
MVDPEQSDFINSGVDSGIRLEEIVWGRVPRDGIPDLINPRVVTPQEAGYLFDDDRVFGVSFNGEHRAYPLRVLNAHEMANDVVGSAPFALALIEPSATPESCMPPRSIARCWSSDRRACSTAPTS